MILSSTINAEFLNSSEKDISVDEQINIDLEKRIQQKLLEDMENDIKKNRVNVPKL